MVTRWQSARLGMRRGGVQVPRSYSLDVIAPCKCTKDTGRSLEHSATIYHEDRCLWVWPQHSCRHTPEGWLLDRWLCLGRTQGAKLCTSGACTGCICARAPVTSTAATSTGVLAVSACAISCSAAVLGCNVNNKALQCVLPPLIPPLPLDELSGMSFMLRQVLWSLRKDPQAVHQPILQLRVGQWRRQAERCRK